MPSVSAADLGFGVQVLALLVAEVSDQPVWWLVGATFTVAAVGFGAILSVWVARKTRHAELLVDLSRRWNDPLTIESWTLFKSRGTAATIKLVERLYGEGVTKRSAEDLRDWQNMSVYADLIEVIAVFVKRRMISRRLIYDMWGGNIFQAWLDYEAPTLRLRELNVVSLGSDREANKILENFQDLAGWMSFYLWAEKNGLPTTRWGWYWLYLVNAPAAWCREFWRYVSK
jgi:hypothetical protein